MRIILTKENHDTTLRMYEKQLLDRTARIEYDFYLGNEFITDCDESNFETTLNAYKHLGEVTVESVLICEPND